MISIIIRSRSLYLLVLYVIFKINTSKLSYNIYYNNFLAKKRDLVYYIR